MTLALRKIRLITGMLILGIACLSISACGSLSIGGQQPMSWYTLNDQLAVNAADRPIPDSTAPKAGVLLIGPIGSNPFYDSTQLVFSRSDIARAYYQFASWTERPTKRLAVVIEERLTARGQFDAVANSTAGIRGDLLLNLTLDEMYHDTTVTPQLARVVIRAVLVDSVQRSQVAQRKFETNATVSTPDAPNAVRAINNATGRLLDELSIWVEKQSLLINKKPSS